MIRIGRLVLLLVALSQVGWCFSGILLSLGKLKNNPLSRHLLQRMNCSMAAVICDLKWLKGLLLSLGVHHPKAIKLFCDIQSASHIAKNPIFYKRTKHIEIDRHFDRDAIVEGLISPSYAPTSSQLADIFTKALGKSQFDYLSSLQVGHFRHSCSNLRGVLK